MAKGRDYGAVLDDLLARNIARTYGVDFFGTPHILIVGIQERLITKEDALGAVGDMIEVGWRRGPELYREIIRLIRDL